ncbi:MAG: fumarylacetoacetate hydrolase family protein [Pseudomonadota bacterium]|nr:fumarylacetoacetate hydrolase family protein [Pseudomonadota bacterium]
MERFLKPEAALPEDGLTGTLVGRAWVPGDPPGPSVVALREDGVYDITRVAPTMSDLLELASPAQIAREAEGERIGSVEEVLTNSHADVRNPDRPYLLTPVDLQALKAAGVTFIASLLERVIEEQARGNPERADAVRARITDLIGTSMADIRPGSEAAQRLKAHLVAEGAWSQYLEVGIGPDAEIFTKAQPMSAVGTGAEIGVRADSTWNNPEPEVVLVVNSAGDVAGATLGNDVNLRDFEGRSALLLPKAKDNNASCAIGPFIRLFDDSFSIDDVRSTQVSLLVEGARDGYRIEGISAMSRISRDPLDIVEQAIGPDNQYPDGFALFLGTMFVPAEDRDGPGQGFTHKRGDLVVIRSAALGALANRVTTSDAAPPWTFGLRALMRNLNARGLL